MKEALKLIGNTPVYQIPGTQVFVKLEKFNLGGSVKDRAVLGMMLDAQANHRLQPDSVIVEATSGNTGIAIALLANIFQVKAILVMPETMSVERRQMIQAYGAELILTPGVEGMKGAIAKANELLANNDNAIDLGQFDNEANANYHEQTTGVEILKQVPHVTTFITGVGTGGTFTGVSRALKQHNLNIKTIVMEPESSPLLSKGQPAPHKIAGISAGFVPGILDRSLIDGFVYVSNEEAFATTKQFVKDTGIFVGISSGANIHAALEYAKHFPNEVIVTIAPDGGEKYLSVLGL